MRVPESFEVTFDKFFPGPQNGPKWPNMAKKGQKKNREKNVKKYFSKVGGMGPKAFKIYRFIEKKRKRNLQNLRPGDVNFKRNF